MSLHCPGHCRESAPIDQLDRLPSGKRSGVRGEASTGDQDSAVGTLCSHHAKQLPDTLNWHLAIDPVLALNNDFFAAAPQLEIDTSVGLASASLGNHVPLAAVGVADHFFKIAPIEIREALGSAGSGQQDPLPAAFRQADQTGRNDARSDPWRHHRSDARKNLASQCAATQERWHEVKKDEEEDGPNNRCPQWKFYEASEQFLEDALSAMAHAFQNEGASGSLCEPATFRQFGPRRCTIAAAVTFEDFRQWAIERSTGAARRWEDPYDDEMQVLLGQDEYSATHIVGNSRQANEGRVG